MLTTNNREHFCFKESEQAMIEQSTQARKIRYTFLLTPQELELARELAKREYRTLPDFFRVRIHNPPKPKRAAKELQT